MSDTPDTAAPSRPRRSDARRSIDAILDAARIVLGERPDASMEEIATKAGVTRQTVYAHFPSRDALMAALIETAAAEYAALLDAADLETAPPADALAGFLDAGWRFLRRYPLLLDPTVTWIPRPTSNDPHDVVPPRLERLIQRGQRTGDLDGSVSAAWLTAAVIGLQHAAAAEVSAARLSADEAATLCLESTLRICGSTTTRPTPTHP
ncbi:TetR/AcrR family transcriptional regulator [Actinomadura darangshiensis]|uniref:TetR/AcrR family transcriptional regulator n=1 Tax=Actinomadura darangshiensis TaxID=705336 RepID=A0A4R4ZQ05_9ACTN|nr:TetR/AcrR family transcriptional regulator [Actinomadura darangshiensis]TDD59939.1 TetR/AcrR family transcriptional regulator [Actinomadura darangshiensis]